jgi:predicted phosphoribosyltransferase
LLPRLLGAVSRFYDTFNPLEDTEVVAILHDANHKRALP